MGSTKKLAGKVAIVTGASGGIGGAIGKRLAEAGARVACADVDAAAAAATARAITGGGGKAIVCHNDVIRMEKAAVVARWKIEGHRIGRSSAVQPGPDMRAHGSSSTSATRDIMKRTVKILIATTILAGLGVTGIAATGFAQPRGDAEYRHGRTVDGGQWYGRHAMGRHGKRRHHGRRMFRLMERYDTNGDHRLTQAEIDEVRAARLDEFDRDGDGALTLAEYQALWLDAMRERMVDRFQHHDADGDGKVTREEFGRRFASIVTRMDRNDDGVLDKSDMRRGHGRWGGGRHDRDAGQQ